MLLEADIRPDSVKYNANYRSLALTPITNRSTLDRIINEKIQRTMQIVIGLGDDSDEIRYHLFLWTLDAMKGGDIKHVD
jgi:hypothetical protein